MRVENHVHIRHIMLYHFEKGHKTAEAFRDLNELFGEGTIGERQVQRWFERFKSGDFFQIMIFYAHYDSTKNER